MVPSDYSITAYDAALVIADAVKRLIADKKDVTRDNVRDYIQTAKVKTLQGTVCVRCQRRPGGPHDQRVPDQEGRELAADDMVHQYHYIGVAPQS